MNLYTFFGITFAAGGRASSRFEAGEFPQPGNPHNDQSSATACSQHPLPKTGGWISQAALISIYAQINCIWKTFGAGAGAKETEALCILPLNVIQV